MDNPIDKVITRKKKVEAVNKEIKRRRKISKKTRGKTRKRKKKNKGKKRKKKVVTTTQTKQPPIRLTDKEAKALLQVNITAKERRKKRKPKTFAEKRAEEIRKTGVADPAVLKAQQKISSEVLGYTTQTRDPLTLMGRRGRYNVEGGVGGFYNVSGRYNTFDDDLGLRTGLQSEAIKSIERDDIIDRLNALEMDKAKKARRKRLPNMGGGRGGGRGRRKAIPRPRPGMAPPHTPPVRGGRRRMLTQNSHGLTNYSRDHQIPEYYDEDLFDEARRGGRMRRRGGGIQSGAPCSGVDAYGNNC